MTALQQQLYYTEAGVWDGYNFRRKYHVSCAILNKYHGLRLGEGYNHSER